MRKKTWEIDQASSMRLTKSEEESTKEAWIRMQEILLDGLALLGTVTVTHIGDMNLTLCIMFDMCTHPLPQDFIFFFLTEIESSSTMRVSCFTWIMKYRVVVFGFMWRKRRLKTHWFSRGETKIYTHDQRQVIIY